jgi:uncharacterized protein (TIGR03643 family)
MAKNPTLAPAEVDRVIEMAWEDRTPFGAIEFQFGLNEQDVIKLMRRELSRSGFKRWRRRVSGRQTKHSALRNYTEGRFRSGMQRQISKNIPSKAK